MVVKLPDFSALGERNPRTALVPFFASVAFVTAVALGLV